MDTRVASTDPTRSAAEVGNPTPTKYATPVMMTLAAYPHLNRTRSTLNVIDFSFGLIHEVKWFFERKKEEKERLGLVYSGGIWANIVL
jgi:hypothetical protein